MVDKLIRLFASVKSSRHSGSFITSVKVDLLSQISDEMIDLLVHKGKCTNYDMKDLKIEKWLWEDENVGYIELCLGYSRKTNNHEAFKSRGNERFSESNLHQYIKASGDDNYIHQGENAIIPGLMLLNKILDGREPMLNVKCVFKQPLFVNQYFDMDHNCIRRGDDIIAKFIVG